MPAGITFQIKESFILRQNYIKQYKSEVLKIRNNPELNNNRLEKLQELRKKFVKKSKYVKDHLSKGLSLKKDKKGYYLVLDAQEISKRKLSDIGKKYNPDLTISVLQASC